MVDSQLYDTADLVYLMERLRDRKTGCPWDIEQSFASVVPCTLEETYEVIDAIEREDFSHLREELGDLLFQVIFYCQLGAEREQFDFADVVSGLVHKLIARHPHVFPDKTLTSERQSDEVLEEGQIKNNWEALKRRDRRQKGVIGRLADVPLALPALSRSTKLQKRASRHGFDWSHINQVVDKIDEELAELKEALDMGSIDLIEEELGDLFFACVNFSRHSALDAESVLRRANRKFESRFAAMEQQAREDGVDFDALPADEKNRLWELAKQIERKP